MTPDILSRVLEPDILFLLIGGTIAIVAIVAGSIKSMVRSVVRERTRREIAAYIAEGSMNAEQGERLMAAGDPKKGGCC
jgi:putative cell wall-binding protein